MKGYKGFDKDLKCRSFQYEVGKEFETESKPVRCTNNGFHFCENPMDVFSYYPPSDSRYCAVEAIGDIDKGSDDSKIATSKIKIGLEIGLKGIIEAGVKFILEKVDWNNKKESNTEERSLATNTGDQSAATNTGDWSAATNTGDQSAATNTGYRSAATNTGDWSAATNTGYRSAATVEGKESIALSMGIEGKAKGALGCWIVLSEWFMDNSRDWYIKEVKVAKIDGEIIKANTWYILKDGEFVEYEEEP